MVDLRENRITYLEKRIDLTRVSLVLPIQDVTELLLALFDFLYSCVLCEGVLENDAADPL